MSAFNEAVSVVKAALKVERMLVGWAEKLTPEERIKVTQELSDQGVDTQALLDIWDSAKKIADGERDARS
jgi:hypothetical protein